MPSRDEVWKSQYEKLVEYKRKHDHTKVMRSESESLYIWCYTQRKKRRDGSDALTPDRIQLLDDLDFLWEINSVPGRGRPKSKEAIQKVKDSSTTTKSPTRVAKSPTRVAKSPKRETPASRSSPKKTATTTVTKPPKKSPQRSKRPSLKTMDLKKSAAAAVAEAAALAMDDDDDDDESKDMDDTDMDAVPALAPEPNKGFLAKSYDAAKWVAQGTGGLLKMFVSF